MNIRNSKAVMLTEEIMRKRTDDQQLCSLTIINTHVAFLTQLKAHLYLNLVWLCHSISCANLCAPVILSFVDCAYVGCVQVSVTQYRDYLMFDNSHYQKTRAETVSTLRLHPRLIFAK